ncbi:MAG: hypothetical protein EHM70_10310 [Chloroflexota bacterium]|nr:MAG: hypothetical protein EHM70_10310 [Chloroflexota bacterium]
MKNIARSFFALWYLLGWVVHLVVVVRGPQFYAPFGDTALIPAFGDFWTAVVMPNITLFAVLLMVFELAVGMLLIGKGRQVKAGLAASLLFNLFLVQLGLTVPASDPVSDFVSNRLPNLVFIALQIPLLFQRFDRSIPEIVLSKLRGRARKHNAEISGSN